MSDNEHKQDSELASRNKRLAVLLGIVALTIYLGYIVVYAF